jgi:hypothetical protein
MLSTKRHVTGASQRVSYSDSMPTTLWRKTMANTEIQYLKKRVNQLEHDMKNMVMALIELKVFKIKVDENGNAIYDTDKDGE